MAVPKLSSSVFSMSLLLILIFLFLFPIWSHARSSPSPPSSSSFEFLKDLQGCHKGDKVKGIHKLKKYLQQFGYLSYHHNSHAKNKTHAGAIDDNDDFDDLVESAVKTYQTNYHLKTTGSLDSETVSQMVKPRCGVADIINGTTGMRSGKKKKTHHDHHHGSHGSGLSTVDHYSFFPGSPRWPSSKSHLTYAFYSGTPSWARSPVSLAFQQWASATHFTFSEAQDEGSADLKIGFHRGDHGDGYPFDGPGSTIAHAFSPTDGRFHYDADERWAIGAVRNAMDLETVAVHEIGHLLGLGHSSVPGAIMFPTITAGVTKRLHADDIQGIRALYNR